MSIIPSHITTIEDARHWLRINGYSQERIESMLADWSALEESAPLLEAVEDDSEEDDWEWEDEEDDLEEDDQE
jgi:hypothetical protein